MKKPRQVLRRALLLVLTAAALAADSKYHLQVTRYELRFAVLPAALDGYRIVLLSDLHGAYFGRDNARLAEKVAALSPDLIALTGDFADGTEEIGATASLLERLQGVAPIAFVSGNHDWAGGAIEPLRRLLDRYGVLRLENRYFALEYRGARFILAGVEDPNGPADMIRPDELAARLREEYPEDFTL